MTQPAPDTRPGAPVGGTLTSGVFPNRDNDNAPDPEQLKRLQARQEHDKATGKRTTHPSFTRTGPDRSKVAGLSASSNRSHAEAKADGEEL